MKKFFWTIAIILCFSGFATAQTKSVTVFADDVDGRKIIMTPMDKTGSSLELSFADGKFAGNIEESNYGFYSLVTVKGYSQVILPVYLPTGQNAEIHLNLTDDSKPMIDGSNENKALAAYSRLYVEKNKALWNNRGNGAEGCKDVVVGFLSAADSIAKFYDCNDATKDYLSMWSYISANDALSSLPRILGVKADSMPFKRSDILPEPHKVLDSPLAALFPNTPHIVFASLPNKNNLDSALVYLDTMYRDEQLKGAVKNDIAARYVSRYNYAVDFDKGLERIRKATEQYGLDPKFVKDFERRKATVPGQEFPKNVTLRDVNGNVVDFATFRGKYVYIDLWASWCVPCLREVPALQKLEKELKNDKVVFLSISIDAKEEAWKNKMKEKNMHGNQLWDSANSLGQALNVKGIPFFAIYDPEGKLYMHGAPRPSQGPGLVRLLEDLK